MNIVRFPKREDRQQLLKRPAADPKKIETDVLKILDAVSSEGDQALRNLTSKFDGVTLENFEVTAAEFAEAEMRVPLDLKNAIGVARSNIERFHTSQTASEPKIETMPGVVCWRKTVAIEKVGLYVPAGTAPLFSTVLMLGIPAAIAGCREIVLCSPPNLNGQIADTILYTAKLCGIDKVFKAGGAQAIAAMAYGTETVPRVDKIFGPGNQYVTAAKQLVSSRVAIDMPAGPSELAVLADETCDPRFVAADLLSQAEHGPDSQVILVSTSEDVIRRTLNEIERQKVQLPRRSVAESSLSNSTAVLIGSVNDGIELLNEYAAEHLILAVAEADKTAESVVNAGSVFIGNYSCESSGDYASGTNHTLPTGGFARSMSGVSVDSFVKKITFQKLSADGIRNIGPTIECMAAAEGLEAHKNAISIRTEALYEL